MCGAHAAWVRVVVLNISLSLSVPDCRCELRGRGRGRTGRDTGLGSCPAIEVVVRRWARLSVGRWDRCGDDKWSAVHWVMALVELTLVVGVRYCCCCRRRYLLRRRDCAVSGSCRNKWPGPRRLWVSVSVLFYPGRKAIESGWLGMAWEPGPGWAVRCLYEEKLIDFFLSRNYQSHIPAVDRERRWALKQ